MTHRNLLLAALRRRIPGEDPTFDVTDYVYAHGSPLLTLMYAELFRPNFVEVDGMVFEETKSSLAPEFVYRVRQAFQQYSRDPEMTQRAFNFIEVPHLFGRDQDDLDDELFEDLARMMLGAWEDRLKRAFPSYIFECELVEANENEDGGFMFYRVSDPNEGHGLARQARRHRQDLV